MTKLNWNDVENVAQEIKKGNVQIEIQSEQFNSETGSYETCLFLTNLLGENDWIRLFGEEMDKFIEFVPVDEWYDEKGVLK